MKKARVLYGIAFSVLLAVEILIALFVRDAFVRPYVGDVLVVVLLCCLIRTVFPGGTLFLSFYVFLFASAVEVGQYFDYASLLGLQGSRFFRTLLGSTFSVADLICYAVGCALFFVVENLIISRLDRRKGRED